MSDLASEFLDIACCPACHGSFAVNYEESELVCANATCGLCYPIRDGIAVLLVDQARQPEGH